MHNLEETLERIKEGDRILVSDLRAIVVEANRREHNRNILRFCGALAGAILFCASVWILLYIFSGGM